MRLTFLGTAAAEGLPALWCGCALCRRAKHNGGRDLRRRCSYLVDDDTLIDLGPDFAWQSAAFGVDLTRIKRLLVTHDHGDHLQPMELIWRLSPVYSQVERPLTVVGSRRIFAAIDEFLHRGGGEGVRLDALKIRPLEIAAGERVDDRGLTVTAFAADHAPGTQAQFFAVGREGRRVLVANDTGFPDAATWEALARSRFDLVSVDCTMGLKERDCRRGHMGAGTVTAFRDRLLSLGCIEASTPVYANHFSHNGGADHESLEAYFRPRGIKVAYDGLSVAVGASAAAAPTAPFSPPQLAALVGEGHDARTAGA